MKIISFNLGGSHPFTVGKHTLLDGREVLISKEIENDLADLVINHNQNTCTEIGQAALGFKPVVVTLNRETKSTQTKKLNHLFHTPSDQPAENTNNPHQLRREDVYATSVPHSYEPIIEVTKESMKQHGLHDDTRYFIMKPNAGARSIGMLIIENPNFATDTKTYLPDFFALINEGLYKLKRANEDKPAYETLQEDLKRISPHIKYYHPGAENNPGEGFDYYPNAVVTTTYLDNVCAEYRLIAIGGEIVFINQRERYPSVNNDFSFPDDPEHRLTTVAQTQSLVAKGEALNDGFIHLVQIIEEINAKLKYFLPHYGSLDLVLTHDHKWSIIEYSEQFSWGEFNTTNAKILKDLTLTHLLNLIDA